jgi:hypothetical protein
MAEISSIAVVEYLKKGSSSVPVTQNDIERYFSDFVLSNPDLPLHYQLRLDELLREYEKNGDISKLQEYLSDVLKCSVFSLDLKTGNLILRGLNVLSEHGDFPLLLHFLENSKSLVKYFSENFSLYPIEVKTVLTIGNRDVFDIGFLSTDYRDMKIGLVGDLAMDYDLAVGILSYLNNNGPS